MVDINRIRENPQEIQKAAMAKGVSVDIDTILKLDEQVQSLSREAQQIREERNALVKNITGKPSPEQVEKGKTIKEELEKKEEVFRIASLELNTLLLTIPNPSKPDVKVGRDESENEIIKTVGTPKKFDFKVKDHLELGESLGIIDVKQAA